MSIVQTPFFIKLQKIGARRREDDLENIVNEERDEVSQVRGWRKRWIALGLVVLGLVTGAAVISILLWTFAYPVMKNI